MKCSSFFLLGGVLWWAASAPAGLTGYEALTEWDSLPKAKTGEVAGLASSYDRDGGNEDYNFYESPTKTDANGIPEPLDYDANTVITTLTGPGIITRFWMPHRTADQNFPIKVTVDGSTVINTNSSTFFSGSYAYMNSPLSSTLLGGQVGYDPIAFQHSLVIESRNFANNSSYYQFGYRLLDSSQSVTPYTGTLTPAQQAARDAAAGIININNVGANPAGPSATSTVIQHSAATISGHAAMSIADLAGSGEIRRLNLKMAGAGDAALDGLRLRVRYDGAADYAIDVPVSQFFGAGHQRVAYKSLPIGTDGAEGFYSYWPMPYGAGAVVELYNSTGGDIGIDSAAVEYEQRPVGVNEGRLHAVFSEETTVAGQEYHQLLKVDGRGHYVGNLLYVERDNDIGRNILEGDDIIIVDGAGTLYGTGLEDAYNGGYYYNHVTVREANGDVGLPESGIEPFNGLLHMDDRDFGDNFVRTDQYRWLIDDYVPFSQGIEVLQENYGQGAGVLMGSTAFYYLVPEPSVLLLICCAWIVPVLRRPKRS